MHGSRTRVAQLLARLFVLRIPTTQQNFFVDNLRRETRGSLVAHSFSQIALGFANEGFVAIGQPDMSVEILGVAFVGFGLD